MGGKQQARLFLARSADEAAREQGTRPGKTATQERGSGSSSTSCSSSASNSGLRNIRSDGECASKIERKDESESENESERRGVSAAPHPPPSSASSLGSSTALLGIVVGCGEPLLARSVNEGTRGQGHGPGEDSNRRERVWQQLLCLRFPCWQLWLRITGAEG